MPEQTNPTKRIHEILKALISHEEKRDTSVPIQKFLMMLLNPSMNINDFYDAISELIGIVNSCENVIKQNGDMTTEDKDLHLDQLRRVRIRLFNVKPGDEMTFSKQFSPDFMESLQWAARDMAYYWDEEIISEENLATLQTDVEDVINKVVDSDLEDELKRILFDGLESVRRAILNYQILGAEGIRQALDRNIGLIHRYGEDFKRASESDDTGVFSNLFDLLKKLDALVVLGLRVRQLGEPVTQILMLGSGG